MTARLWHLVQSGEGWTTGRGAGQSNTSHASLVQVWEQKEERGKGEHRHACRMAECLLEVRYTDWVAGAEQGQV